MCLFCTLMFMFSALLVFSSSLELWGCCWIVRITVGCWLEVTVNGLIMLTSDILRCGIYFLGRGREERENVCGWADLTYRFLLCSPCCSVRSNWLAHSPSFAHQGNDVFWFIFPGCPQCAWFSHAGKAMQPFLLKSSSSSPWVPEVGTAFTDTAMGHAASQHLRAGVSQGYWGAFPSFEPALAWVWLESESLRTTGLG